MNAGIVKRLPTFPPMKTKLMVCSLAAVLGLATLSATKPPVSENLVAHEWGTFTAVIGSDGMEVPWWTPRLEGPAALPEFVKPVGIVVAGKSGQGVNPTLLRMETPVIYFYSDRSADIVASVDTRKVRLTEVFPAVVPSKESVGKREWKIRIEAPGDEIGKSMPPVGERGAHYAYAREVPDAWWVVRPNEDKSPEVEKFIFYRGTADLRMPKRVYGVSDKGPLLVPGEAPLYLVEVDDTRLRWKRIDPIVGENRGTEEILRPSLDAVANPDENALISELVAQLSSAGLSSAEARAMVRTWREAWLHEPGLRLLEILPRTWVDEVLPLSISPAPSRLERVFVARWEMLTPETETEVLDILELTGTPESKAAAIEKLELSRFGAAAFDRAARIRDARFRSEFQQVMMTTGEPITTDAATP